MRRIWLAGILAVIMVLTMTVVVCAEEAVKVKTVTPAEKKISLAPGTTWQAAVEIAPEDATDKSVTWKSSNEKVATVDESGMITGVKKGSCKITATANDGSKKKAEISVNVKEYDAVLIYPAVLDTFFDTTEDYAEYEVGFNGRSSTTVYSRTVKFTGDVVESAGDHKLKPVKAGEGTVEVLAKENNKVKEKGKYTVFVAPTAVTDKAIPDTLEMARNRECWGSTELVPFWRYYGNDGDIESYWESEGYPAEWTVDLGTELNVSSIVVRLNPDKSWKSRTQTIEVLVSPDSQSYTKVLEATEFKYDPKTGNRIVISLEPVDARFVQLRFLSGTWKNAQAAEVLVNVTADQRAKEEQERIQNDPFNMMMDLPSF